MEGSADGRTVAWAWRRLGNCLGCQDSGGASWPRGGKSMKVSADWRAVAWARRQRLLRGHRRLNLHRDFWLLTSSLHGARYAPDAREEVVLMRLLELAEDLLQLHGPRHDFFFDHGHIGELRRILHLHLDQTHVQLLVLPLQLLDLLSQLCLTLAPPGLLGLDLFTQALGLARQVTRLLARTSELALQPALFLLHVEIRLLPPGARIRCLPRRRRRR
mmetsp:Transcript_87530/g.245866  ORF Transcript_87530/g.245866 Transcript_87530/m.245866 type:complete len:217 (+) Transcript_87530:861-1511(+)